MSQVTENNVNAAPAPMTPLREFWHYFKRNKGAVVGLAYVLIVILIAVFANFIAPYNRQSSSAMRCWRRRSGRKAAVGRIFWERMMLVAMSSRA